jgi:uncharacterized protein YjbI with pentapeptide repeats
MEPTIIGSKIANARKSTNLSQAQLAQRLFISPQAVGKWERGESVPDIITFNRLAEVLGVDLNYFSENFQSVVLPAEPAKSISERLGELDLEKPVKKQSWDMSRFVWADVDFSGLKDLHEKFTSSDMRRCKFIGSSLSGLLLRSNHVDSCDFSDSDMKSSRLQNSHLVNSLFNNCVLKEAEFSGSHIQGCNFSGADLTGAGFKHSSFQKNAMAGAILKRTSFIGTSISDVVFEGAVEDCYFDNCGFSKVTFQNATLTNTFFKSRKLKQLRFIDCRADRLTYEFLKAGKANLDGVSLLSQ